MISRQSLLSSVARPAIAVSLAVSAFGVAPSVAGAVPAPLAGARGDAPGVILAQAAPDAAPAVEELPRPEQTDDAQQPQEGTEAPAEESPADAGAADTGAADTGAAAVEAPTAEDAPVEEPPAEQPPVEEPAAQEAAPVPEPQSAPVEAAPEATPPEAAAPQTATGGEAEASEQPAASEPTPQDEQSAEDQPTGQAQPAEDAAPAPQEQPAEQASEGETAAPDAEQPAGGGEPPQEEDGGEPPQEEDGGEPPQEDVGAEPQQEDVGAEPTQENVGGEPPQEEGGGEPPQEEDGGEPPQEDVGGEPTQEDVGEEPAQENVGGEPAQENVGGEPAQENVGGEPAQENVGGEPAQENVGGEPAQENVGEEPAQEEPGGEPAQEEGVDEQPREEAGEQRPDEAAGKDAGQPVLPVPGGAPVLDSAKEAAPAPQGAEPQTGAATGDRRQGAQPNADGERRRAQQPAAAAPAPPPESDAAAQQQLAVDGAPVEIRSAREERGERRQRPPERDLPDEVTIIEQNDNRTIIEIDNRVYVDNSDRERLGRQAREVYYEELPRGRTREVIVRPNGVEIVTIRNRYGDIIQRSRITPDGRETVLVYVPIEERRERYYYRDPGFDLPPMVLTVPVEEYILDAAPEATREDYYDFLAKPPVERVERLYTVDEVRYSARIRDKLPRVDLDTITFDFGKANIPENEVPRLEEVADAMLALLEEDPAETFLLEGHTDAVGSDQANLVLSDRRAESVAIALTDVFGVPPENLVTQGYGERYLKVETQERERLNRRVTIRRITPLVRPVAEARQ